MANGDFRSQFSHYVAPDAALKKKAFSSGLIVLDTNVLLDLYRYTRESRDELFNVIERLRDKIWIPHQVAEEFYRNRIEVMSSLHDGYTTLRDHIDRTGKKYADELRSRIGQLDNRVHLHPGEREQLEKLLNESFSPLKEAVEKLQREHRPKGSYASDPILLKVEHLLASRVGSPFGDDYDEHLREANRRVEAKEPPGFCDDDKKLPHGDYFVWIQSLQQAKAASAPVLLIVTGDEKEDWYYLVNNRPVCARPELAREAVEKSGAQLIMMGTREFLELSQEHAHTSVSPKTLREAADLPKARNQRLLSDARIAQREEMQMRLLDGARELREAQLDSDRLVHKVSLLKDRAAAETDDLKRASMEAQLAVARDELDAARQALDHRRAWLHAIEMRYRHDQTRGRLHDDDEHLLRSAMHELAVSHAREANLAAKLASLEEADTAALPAETQD